ncbi:MAG: tRNA pseudouridine(38-40) synthase TruA [Gemmatimonadetes bacterium]|nr:tRNA pseudouridine(38-40) synthase TruA [Gemmatimonadota bacterium]
MRTLVLKIEYDGTGFLGWQLQPEGRTVQGVLEEAMRTILQADLRVTAAGRTDAGVHATGQVVHFRTDSDMVVDRLKKGLNGVLPPDVRVLEALQAADDFHARFSAVGRRYAYRITRRPSAIHRHHAWHVAYPLDVDAMRRTCVPLVGRHDFTSFCQATSTADGTECEVRELDWIEEEDELRLHIEANRFLHHMVRTIVGTAVDIGRGRWKESVMAEMLEAKDRRAAGPNAPAHGLCLEAVRYPGEFGI